MNRTGVGPANAASLGIVLMCAGVFLLSVNDALAKALTTAYSPLQVIFMRNLIALPFTVLFAWNTGGFPAMRTSTPGLHLLRAVFWIAGTLFFFTSLMHLELAEATALIFVAPLFITALAALFLGEKTGWRRWLAVGAGFAGVLVVVRPGTATFQPVALLPVLAALAYALLMLAAKRVSRDESAWTLQLYLTIGSLLISLPAIPFVWEPLRTDDLMLFVAIALFSTVGVMFMTQAFRIAPAAVVAPFDYTAMIWATLLGWMFWNELPDAITYLGAAIIIASGVYTIFRERRSGR